MRLYFEDKGIAFLSLPLPCYNPVILTIKRVIWSYLEIASMIKNIFNHNINKPSSKSSDFFQKIGFNHTK
jgi:hypothetical protein